MGANEVLKQIKAYIDAKELESMKSQSLDYAGRTTYVPPALYVHELRAILGQFDGEREVR